MRVPKRFAGLIQIRNRAFASTALVVKASNASFKRDDRMASLGARWRRSSPITALPGVSHVFIRTFSALMAYFEAPRPG